LAVEGAITAAVLEVYIEEVLAPKLRPGQVMVIDNLSAHKGERARKLSSTLRAASYCTCRPTSPTSILRRGPSGI
jgi:hypothetical protein